LSRGMALAKAFGKKLTAVSAFDPYFHYAMFKSLNKALTDKAREVFKFEEQEKLHETIIDSGLAKIYQGYLNIAARVADQAGVKIETRLLDGKPFEKILEFCEQAHPWLLIAGRTGFHSEEGMDLGSNTENLARQCGCNFLVVEGKSKPPVEYQVEETVTWTVEAKARLSGVPAMALPLAMKSIQNYCVAEGHTVVTESNLDEALKAILPPEMLARMGIHLPVAPGNRDLVWEKPAKTMLDSIPDAFGREQIRNRVEKRALTEKAGRVTEERVRFAMPAMSATPRTWTDDAVARLNKVPAGFMRNAAKSMIEKIAVEKSQVSITLEMVEAGLGKARETMRMGFNLGTPP